MENYLLLLLSPSAPSSSAGSFPPLHELPSGFLPKSQWPTVKKLDLSSRACSTQQMTKKEWALESIHWEEKDRNKTSTLGTPNSRDSLGLGLGWLQIWYIINTGNQCSILKVRSGIHRGRRIYLQGSNGDADIENSLSYFRPSQLAYQYFFCPYGFHSSLSKCCTGSQCW